MKEKRYYSIDANSIVRKAENTTKARESLSKSKNGGKFEERLNDIDLFGKRPSELESSIY